MSEEKKKITEPKKTKKPSFFNDIWFWVAIVAIALLLASIDRNNKSLIYNSQLNVKLSATPIQTKTPEKPGGKVEITSDSVKDKANGYKSVIGEVKNKTGGKIMGFDVTAIFYDKNGDAIGESSSSGGGEIVLWSVALEDTQTAPFEILPKRGAGKFDHYKLDASWW